MKDIFRFRNFPVYKAGRQFRKELKELSRKKFPKEEQYSLTSQLWRALDSILLNIAEGSDRFSDMDFSRFLNNSLTSLNEVVACLDCAKDDNYIFIEEEEECLTKAEGLARQLKAFSAKVRKDNVSH
jgi:four helix bundle protein